jgi:hypothetical protein
MTIAQDLDMGDLNRRIELGQRKALWRTIALSIAIVAAAAFVLLVTLREIESANAELAEANAKLAASKTELAQVSTEIAGANAARAKAEADLNAAVAQSTALRAEVGDLTAQLDETKKALAEALDLNKHVYKLEWENLKMMAATYGGVAPLLERIMGLRDDTKWDMSNTPEKGYNSPGFAALVLQQMQHPSGGALGSLPRDNGKPHIGDIVLYAGGYHMFFFRDHEGREFVVGMTPFGVQSLNYNFAKRSAVLRTGFSPE